MQTGIRGGGEKLPHAAVMERLSSLHAPIKELIGSRSIHYVDLPIYGNIGDLLIMLGALHFFDKHHINVAARAAFFNYDPRFAKGDRVIVFQGGGNFGDLYNGPQQIREKVVSSARDTRIIILPQTIHFRSHENASKCFKIFKSHPDVHIFVRDLSSFEYAKNMSEHVYLAPDMAHQLWGCAPFSRATNDLARDPLWLIRTDGESKRPEIINSVDVADWPDLVGQTRTFVIRLFCYLVRQMHLVGINRPFLHAEMSAWVWYANRLALEAVSLLEGRKEVVTDRLHGHILSCLLSVPNRVIDNDYGKNSSYLDVWTGSSEKVALYS